MTACITHACVVEGQERHGGADVVRVRVHPASNQFHLKSATNYYM